MMARTVEKSRKTGETDIELTLNLEGSGQGDIDTGIGFFDHMLKLWAKHALFDLILKVKGDLNVDGHHTVEDTGIVLGQAFAAALGDKQGIKRYGSALIPMDEALVMAAVDISARPFLAYDVTVPDFKIGDYASELTEEFWRAFTVNAALTLHVKLLYGKNSHHIVEAVFKALARALSDAAVIDKRIEGVMSTKGVL